MEKPHLDRRMGLLQATATNIISMVGVGPFLTIPFMVAGDERAAHPLRVDRGRASSRSPTASSTRSSAPRFRAAAAAISTCAKRSSRSASAG